MPTALAALGRLARAGYPVGLTIAPIMPVGDWRAEYGALLDAASPPAGARPRPRPDRRVITHRFTPGSKEVLLGWYPRTRLEMDEDAAHAEARQVRRGEVRLPADVMAELRAWFETALAEPPGRPHLYWTLTHSGAGGGAQL